MSTEAQHRILLLVALVALMWAAYAVLSVARAGGQWDGADAKVRAWFRGVKSPTGVPCCDIADGHRADWDTKRNGYRVRIEGMWFEVPREAVVDNSGNPTGDAVVWYSNYSGKVFIRCFVPGSGG